MKVSLGLPTHRVDRGQDMVSGEAVSEMSRAAEESGFDAVFVTEHPFPGDAWLAHGGHHALDPLVTLAVAGAATTRLRLHTNLFVLGYRNPFLAAKSVATLDVLSGGRVILGVGAGYLEPEFAALGADFGGRNEAMDEALAALRAAWSGESVKMEGRSFKAAGNTMRPTPKQRPGPPIWVGGNSRRAIRRAVELADGWCPFPNPARSARRRRTAALETLEDLERLVSYARGHAEAVGRSEPLEIVFMPIGADMWSDRLPSPESVISSASALKDIGVTYLATSVPGGSRSEYLDNLRSFGEEMLPAIARI